LDVDARIYKYPHLLRRIYCDIGVYYHQGRAQKGLFSSLIYLTYNDKVLELLDRWIKRNSEGVPISEQHNLELSITDEEVFLFPHEYCKIDNTPYQWNPILHVEDPVIEHFQASRTHRRRK